MVDDTPLDRIHVEHFVPAPSEAGKTLRMLRNSNPAVADAIGRALVYVANRALECRILADPEIRNLARYWDAKAGDADETISNVVERLTGEGPSAELIRHLRAQVSSHASTQGGKEPLSANRERTVVEAALAWAEGDRLRCQACGYRFQTEDLGVDRRRYLEEAGGSLSMAPHPRRVGDPLKPLTVRKKRLTNLTIDHVVPESGFG